MANEEKTEAGGKRSYASGALDWLKVIDDWSIGGFKNKLPRLYYLVIVLAIVFVVL